jgi:hypothetical protein
MKEEYKQGLIILVALLIGFLIGYATGSSSQISTFAASSPGTATYKTTPSYAPNANASGSYSLNSRWTAEQKIEINNYSGTNWTIGFWIYPITCFDDSDNYVILSLWNKATDTTNAVVDFVLKGYNKATSLNAYFNVRGGSIKGIDPMVPVGKWSQLVLTYANGVYTLAVNGTQDLNNKQTVTGTTNTGAVTAASMYMTFAGPGTQRNNTLTWNNTPVNIGFNGYMDELFMLNVALSGEEINELYNLYSPVYYSALATYFPNNVLGYFNFDNNVTSAALSLPYTIPTKCQNDEFKFYCPSGQAVTSGTITYGRFDNNTCPGKGVLASTTAKTSTVNVTAGSTTASSLINAAPDPYPSVYKQYNGIYYCG